MSSPARRWDRGSESRGKGCMRIFCLYWPVYVWVFRRADPPSQESYQLSVRFVIFRLILNWEQARGPNLSKEDTEESISWFTPFSSDITYLQSVQILFYCAPPQTCRAHSIYFDLWSYLTMLYQLQR
jgi:hypothetical protein